MQQQQRALAVIIMVALIIPTFFTAVGSNCPPKTPPPPPQPLGPYSPPPPARLVIVGQPDVVYPLNPYNFTISADAAAIMPLNLLVLGFLTIFWGWWKPFVEVIWFSNMLFSIFHPSFWSSTFVFSRNCFSINKILCFNFLGSLKPFLNWKSIYTSLSVRFIFF